MTVGVPDPMASCCAWRTPSAVIAAATSTHLVARNRCHCQPGSKTRAGGYGDASLGVDPERLLQEEVATLYGPTGRIEGELEERPGTNAGGGVQVGQEGQAVGPRWERDDAV